MMAMATAVIQLGLLLCVTANDNVLPAPYDLRVESLENPIGITELRPRLSWKLEDCGRGVNQAAYEIVVTNVDTGVNTWTSKVASNQTNNVVYGGDPLQVDSMYRFSVTWWSTDDRTSVAAFGTFDMAPMNETYWLLADTLGGANQRQYRFEFQVPTNEGAVERSRLHLDAPGCAVVWVNGVLASDPSGVCQWTTYTKTIVIASYNLTSFLQPGANAIGIQLGCGVYCDNGFSPYVRARIYAVTSSGKKITAYSRGEQGPPPPPAPPSPPLLCGVAKEHETVELSCSTGSTISTVTFASFGESTGSCGAEPSKSNENTFKVNPACDTVSSLLILQRACVGKQACVLAPACSARQCHLLPGGTDVADPCQMHVKWLAAAISCNTSATPRAVLRNSNTNTNISSDTDTPWLAAAGPVITNDPWKGTTTNWTVFMADARAGWATTHFVQADSLQTWKNATLTTEGAVVVRRATNAPVSRQIGSMVQAVGAVKTGNACLVTFPANVVGQMYIGASAYTVQGNGSIQLQHSEKLSNDSSTIDPAWGWGNMDVHLFSQAGGGIALWPQFTWHGFQFVEVTVFGDVDVECAPSSFSVSVIHSDVQTTGTLAFEGGDGPFLNKLQTMIVNGQLSNIVEGMPTDCPTREKHGWLGDAQVTAEEAMYNFNMAGIYTEFLNTIRDNQNGEGDVPGVVPPKGPPRKETETLKAAGKKTDISWSAAYPLITAWMYEYYADTRVIVDHFPTLELYVDGLYEAATSRPGGLPDFFTWGDWCAVEARATNTPGTGPELAAFNFIAAVDAMEKMAGVIGNMTAQKKYTAMQEKLRPVFHQRFYNASSGAYGGKAIELQSLTVAPLALGNTIPENLTSKVIGALVDDITQREFHLTVGAVGAKHLLPQLARAGENEVAMKVATQTTFPSFGYWMSLGATTCWESYSGIPDDTHPPTPTHNHIFLCGGAGEWLYRSVGGIAPAAPGFKRVKIFPDVIAKGGPDSANTSMITASGLVTVAWQRATSGVQIAVSISAGIDKATITFRAPDNTIPKDLSVSEGGATVWTSADGFSKSVAGVVDAHWSAEMGGVVEVQVLSGSYSLMFSQNANHSLF
eukprot:m.77460 g.77460  ORF g.77460 m.77460 type:complete len:1094 (-) comp25018_c0_seq1:43-3324(-)